MHAKGNFRQTKSKIEEELKDAGFSDIILVLFV